VGLAGLTESKRAGYSTTKWVVGQPVAIRQCLDSEVRSILGSHVSNFGIERTLANPIDLVWLGLEVRMMNSRLE
jgi:hypothetical protein